MWLYLDYLLLAFHALTYSKRNIYRYLLCDKRHPGSVVILLFYSSCIYYRGN